MNPDPHDKPEEHGSVELTITNEINGHERPLHANLAWTMEKVREQAYKATKDEPRPTDRFTGDDENKAIVGDNLQKTLAEITATNGYLPGERHFHIRGPAGGA